MNRERWKRWVAPLCGVALMAAACGSGSESKDAATPNVFAGMPTLQSAPVARGEEIDVAQVESTTDASGGESAKAPPPGPVAPPPAPTSAPTTPDQPQPNGAGPGTSTSVGANRRAPILIYKADFTMSVYEVEKAIDAVQSLAESNGGYLSRRDDRSITIRIPAGSFQGVVVEIGKLGDVTGRNVVSEDVTAEFRDLEVQLQNQLALRDRFQKLLEKAQKVDEALQIEKELGRVTEEIERIKGRLKLLSDLASYSTITVRFAPRVDQEIQHGPFVLPLPWLNNLGLPRLLTL